MLSVYKVELKEMREDSCEYEYALDDRFFAAIDAPDIRKGRLNVRLTVKKSMGVYVLNFHTEGVVTVPCDRCLDDMELSVETDDTLKVKLGAEFSDEDEIVIVPEEEGFINVAWFMYEFIELSLPMQHIHTPGACNSEMLGVLNEHLATVVDEEADEDVEPASENKGTIDPRWNDLKKILDNN